MNAGQDAGDVPLARSRARRNAPAEYIEHFRAFQERGRWEQIRVFISELLAPDFVVEDHRGRAGSCEYMSDTAGVLSQAMAIGEAGLRMGVPKLLAARGELQALVHATARLSPELTFDLLIGVDCAPDRRIRRMVFHDVEDFVAAFDSLAARFVATLPPEAAAVARVTSQFISAIDRRAFDEVETLLADEFELVDRRGGPGLGFDRAQFLDMLTSVIDDEGYDFVTEVHVVDGRGLVVSRSEVSLDAIDIHSPQVTLAAVRDGKLDVLEFYDADDLDAALARLEQLAAD